MSGIIFFSIHRGEVRKMKQKETQQEKLNKEKINGKIKYLIKICLISKRTFSETVSN